MEQIQLLTKWIAALRSGDYQQTKGVLRARPSADTAGQCSYCCLGVLCDIVDPNKWSYIDELNSSRYTFGEYDFGVTTSAISLFGDMNELLGDFYDEHSRPAAGALAELNDVEGYSFIQIADYIETNILRPIILKEWVKALRSGKYKQTQSTLRSKDSFCCLGVVCDVYDPSKWDVSSMNGLDTYDGKGGYLPDVLNNLLGLKSVVDSPVTEDNDTVMWTLSSLNDTHGWTFDQIADYIEASLIDKK